MSHEKTPKVVPFRSAEEGKIEQSTRQRLMEAFAMAIDKFVEDGNRLTGAVMFVMSDEGRYKVSWDTVDSGVPPVGVLAMAQLAISKEV